MVTVGDTIVEIVGTVGEMVIVGDAIVEMVGTVGDTIVGTVPMIAETIIGAMFAIGVRVRMVGADGDSIIERVVMVAETIIEMMVIVGINVGMVTVAIRDGGHNQMVPATCVDPGCGPVGGGLRRRWVVAPPDSPSAFVRSSGTVTWLSGRLEAPPAVT